MKAPLSWLKDFIPLTQTPQQIAEALTSMGEEVDAIERLSLQEDALFEISLTPNLGHALSMIGIARELAAKFELPLSIPIAKIGKEIEPSIKNGYTLNILAKDLCPRYACRLIREVKVGPSPDWLRYRLEAAGQKSVNNLVDIGNYVMLETGQPLHFFDADKIELGHLIVDRAKDEFSFTLIDGSSCQVPRDTLVIRDGTKALALAGIMGGKSSAITESTRNVLIEAASFLPSAIRRASRRLGLRTEASYRFERGTDPLCVLYALERASAMVEEIAHGQVAQDILQSGAFDWTPKHIECNIHKLNTFLGLTLSLGEVISIFERLSLKIRSSNNDQCLVTIPSFRNDLHIQEDLFEEVARLYGYDAIPESKAKYAGSTLLDTPFFTFETDLRNRLLSQGLQEVVSCDLISPLEAKLSLERGLREDALISVLQPGSIDQSVLRPSLLPGLLKIAKFNQDRGTNDLFLFELGKIHFKENDHFQERPMAGILLKGKTAPYHYLPPPQPTDFFDLKGILENVFAGIKILKQSFQPTHLHSFHPFKQAKIMIDQNQLGIFGEIHPELLLKLGIKEPAFFAELDLLQLMSFSSKRLSFSGIPSFPGSQRDWTVTVKDLLPVGEFFETIREMQSPFLAEVELLDIFKSEILGADNKNVTFRFHYLDRERTMDQALVDEEHTKLKERVAKKLRNYVL